MFTLKVIESHFLQIRIFQIRMCVRVRNLNYLYTENTDYGIPIFTKIYSIALCLSHPSKSLMALHDFLC